MDTPETTERTLCSVLAGEGAVLAKACTTALLNARKLKVLSQLPDGLEDRLTSSKGARIATCSKEMAMRDIAGLVVLNILSKGPTGGRSTCNSLVFGAGLAEIVGS